MTLRDKVDYYVNRLALQYRDRPKARANTAIVVKQAIADDLAASLLSAFDLDTAVGVQLDILGKYLGVSRNIGVPVTTGFFGFWTYDFSTTGVLNADFQGQWDPVTNTPSLSATPAAPFIWYIAGKKGDSTAPIAETWVPGNTILSMGTHWTQRTAANGNGFTTYSDAAINTNGVFYLYSYNDNLNTDLTDESYRTALKLKAILNSNDGTLASIMGYIQDFFSGLIRLVDNRDMSLTYYVDSSLALSEDLLRLYLPRPMGVSITLVIEYRTPEEPTAITTEDGKTITTEGGQTITT